jgi:SAM-dependent methyltransferase
MPHASLDHETRSRKARKILALLGQERFLSTRRMLEVGCGSGLIAGAMARLGEGRIAVDAVDVVDNRVDGQGYDFTLVQGTALPFPDGAFDIVISNHVMEHVGDETDQRHHLEEIRRVLSPRGIVYLAVPNRWRLMEPHFRLPLLSWLPHPASDRYVRAMRRGTHYDCAPPSHQQALALFRSAGFTASDHTIRALRETLRIEMAPAVSRLFDRLVPDWMPRLFMRIMPTYVFLLRHERQGVDETGNGMGAVGKGL